MPSFKPVVAVLRGLDVLRAVNDTHAATVGSIHAATGLDKATIVRMLETLEHGGYVVRSGKRGTYAPAGRTLQLSQGYDLHKRLQAAADPILAAFRRRVGWPSDLAICERDEMMVVQTSREQGPLHLNRRPGYRAPVLVTSMGRAYLAFCAEKTRQAILDRLAMKAEGGSLDLPRIEAMLAEVRVRGFAVMDDTYSASEYENLVWAMAVPVMDGPFACAALNIMMLRSAVSFEAAISQFLEPLRETAAQVAEAIRAEGGIPDFHTAS
ncbi:helix-turn-helix domain-containing protein [Xanthobacter dioxanivorans]|uniref:Helix-turn-helix domain-containing protein n=1 Tax=Xanthobacter dioxanivorans TaxID=2528964 RepID=A0A974SFU6_9HYPH|nr:IclR family transcriptional regulator C-terminal domain-containing protein [Xanthobacter dioxanivorans]QRG04646.1 helix-turn-helix domain-containing protein [Xanthobacter dioxanivorans]